MSKYKVLLVFGTRPEAIKMCPVILELKKHKEIKTIVCLTGQHREMLTQVMDLFQIEEDYNLDIMKDGQTLTSITIDIMSGIEKILLKEEPDIMLVHGDTTSSYAAALAGFYNKVPIGHIEAGLRTYDMMAPYPEEFNRQCVDKISDICFAPTTNAYENLIAEHIDKKKIFVTGNTVIDALKTTIHDNYTDEVLEKYHKKKIILMTIHRRENIGKPMMEIFNAVRSFTREHEDVVIIYPIHKNPRIREIADKIFRHEKQVVIIEPLDAMTFHNYVNNCYFILTDSGGIQEEAPSLGKPVLVARDITERPEGVEAGTIKVIGTNERRVFENLEELYCDKTLYKEMSQANNPYGDGHSSERIVNIILERMNEQGSNNEEYFGGENY